MCLDARGRSERTLSDREKKGMAVSCENSTEKRSLVQLISLLDDLQLTGPLLSKGILVLIP